METRQKKYYEAPSTVVFEVRQESVICGSEDPQFHGFGGEEDMCTFGEDMDSLLDF